MSSVNLGWLFYKGYYKTLNNNDYIFMLLSNEERKNRKEEQEALNEKITKQVEKLINQSVTIEDNEMLGNTHFKATTTYPGLILGSGNAHELPSIEGQAILGFHFDYTTGLPTIQGSSIKGVLRSAFRHKEYIEEYVGKEVDIEALEQEIFDNGDVFFDAVVVSSGKILGDDFLAPHGDPLKNPTPLRFIKVLPNVEFRFDFELSDGLISKGAKDRLFRKILEDLGLGAKTNVGYGKFTNFKKEQTEEEKEEEQRAKELQIKQDKERKEREKKELEEAKAKKKQEGLNALLDCKTLADGFKLLKDSFGKKPKPTNEEKEIIKKFMNMQKKLSKGDIKTFKKYGM